MDKQTFLAIAISMIILTIWFGYQSNQQINNTQNLEDNSVEATRDTEVSKITPVPFEISPKLSQIEAFNPIETSDSNPDKEGAISSPAKENPEANTVSINNGVFNVVFSTKNASIISVILNLDSSASENINALNQKDLELLPQGENANAFRILWGDKNIVDEEEVIYKLERTKNDLDFSREFETSDGQRFVVHKIYTIHDDDYVIELKIRITNKQNKILSLGNNYAYSLYYGPQLGPFAEVSETQKSKQLSRRRLVGLDSKKLRYIKVRNNSNTLTDKFYKWVGITGRYISLLILTGSTSYTTEFSTYDTPGLNSGAQILLRRPQLQSSAVEDKYRIYIGPNVRKILKKYNNPQLNSFNLQDAQFDEVSPARLLNFLQVPMHGLMLLIYRLIPNFGIAIILLTLIVRLITVPVIKKSKETGKKMRALGPKMQSIKERFSDDPMRMNQEMMALYRREKVSPFSSMLPMFIQLPFFLAMYRVIYESFELWQAPFAGWMQDLSSPDQLFSFGDYTLPFLGWNSFNLLPLVMLATQYISSFIMMKQQDQSSATAGSQRMIFIMSYVFPFMIFFALYNSPSGLILYWICSNIFTVLAMNDWKKKPEPELVDNIKSKRKSKK